MTDRLIAKLKNEENSREVLAEIIAAVNDDAALAAQFKAAFEQENLLLPLLAREDAKTRKNAAKLIGKLKLDGAAQALYEAYNKETTLFVKPAELSALCELNTGAYRDEFKKRLAELENTEFSKEEQKHILEEIRILRELAGTVAEAPHTFTGFAGPAELMLYTTKGLEDLVAGKLTSLNPKTGSGVVRVSAKFLRDVLPIRTVEEILFLIPEYKAAEFDPEAVAQAVASSRLFAFLDRRHKEQGRAYRFRADMRTALEPEKKTKFIKAFGAALEVASGYKFLNSGSDYEIELRIIERKDGKADCLLKLFTIKDERFAYKTESISAGLKPVTAATAIAFAGDFLKENAQVYDPFCGAGTLLTERAVFGKVRNIYGTDTFGAAIEKARKNTANLGIKGNYINRDFFDFKHEYLFDEVITELPYLSNDAKAGEKAALKLTYRHFFDKIKTHMVKDGTLVLLAKESIAGETLRISEMAGKACFKCMKSARLNNNETVFILKNN